MAALRTTLPLRAPLRQSLAQAQAQAPRRAAFAVKGPASAPSRAAARPYSTSPSGGNSGGSTVTGTNILVAVGVLGAAGAAFYALGGDEKKSVLGVGAGHSDNKLLGSKGKAGVPSSATATTADYQKVYNAIAAALEKDENYDDGSFGPVLVRLAWHSSGTYDKSEGTGGSNGATMRFAPEADHGANAGLLHARQFMEDIKKQFPWVSYSDLWTLGGIVAVQEMGGPQIAWRPGRSDREQQHCPPDGRLPDGDKGHDHLRSIFYRMGFNDQEIVALSGAHALGRCHKDRSGFDGPWQHSPTSFTNVYYDLLLNEKWAWRKWDGPKQFQDKSTQALMMLPTDMALIQDKSFRKYVEKYAKSEEAFFDDFSKVFAKLLELGVPDDNFKNSSLKGEPMHLKTTADQGL